MSYIVKPTIQATVAKETHASKSDDKKYNALKKENEKLQSDYKVLEELYGALEKDNKELEAMVEELSQE